MILFAGKMLKVETRWHTGWWTLVLKECSSWIGGWKWYLGWAHQSESDVEVMRKWKAGPQKNRPRARKILRWKKLSPALQKPWNHRMVCLFPKEDSEFPSRVPQRGMAWSWCSSSPSHWLHCWLWWLWKRILLKLEKMKLDGRVTCWVLSWILVACSAPYSHDASVAWFMGDG